MHCRPPVYALHTYGDYQCSPSFCSTTNPQYYGLSPPVCFRSFPLLNLFAFHLSHTSEDSHTIKACEGKVKFGLYIFIYIWLYDKAYATKCCLQSIWEARKQASIHFLSFFPIHSGAYSIDWLYKNVDPSKVWYILPQLSSMSVCKLVLQII